MENSRRVFPTLNYSTSAVEACDRADAVLVLTEWDEFVAMRPDELADIVNAKVIVDGRNCLDATSGVRRAGGSTHWAGRPDFPRRGSLRLRDGSRSAATNPVAGPARRDPRAVRGRRPPRRGPAGPVDRRPRRARRSRRRSPTNCATRGPLIRCRAALLTFDHHVANELLRSDDFRVSSLGAGLPATVAMDQPQDPPRSTASHRAAVAAVDRTARPHPLPQAGVLGVHPQSRRLRCANASSSTADALLDTSTGNPARRRGVDGTARSCRSR